MHTARHGMTERESTKMTKRHVFLACSVVLAGLLAACGGGGGGGTPDPTPPDGLPTTGPYVSTVYTSTQLQSYKDVAYSVRPNAGGQYTSENTQASEKNDPTLTMKMDIWVPPNATAAKPQPAIIVIHGGFFYKGNKEDQRGRALSYAQAGYVTASINYRLTPDNDTSSALRLRAVTHAADDTANAVRYLKSMAATYHLDPQRIAIIGTSAGGAAALLNGITADELAGTTSDYPGISAHVAAVVSTGATLIDPLVDSSTLVRYDRTDSPVLMFHANPTDPTTAATWTGNALPTRNAIVASGNSCTLVDQGSSHTVDLDMGGAWWSTIKAFIWSPLNLAAFRSS